MFKLFALTLLTLSLLLGGCEARQAPSVNSTNDPKITAPDLDKNKAQVKDIQYKFNTPLRIGKKVTELTPYLMSTYSFHKRIRSTGFLVSIYTAHTEEMIYEGEEPVVAIMFVSKGDLHEMPLAFYIIGELDPKINNTLNFCALSYDDKMVLYASATCLSEGPPNSQPITLKWTPSSNSVTIAEQSYPFESGHLEAVPVFEDDDRVAPQDITGDYICTMTEHAGVASSHMEGSGQPKAFHDSSLAWKFKLRVGRDEKNRSKYRMIELPYSGLDREPTDWHTDNSVLHSPYVGNGIEFSALQGQAFVSFHKTVHESEDGDMSFYHSGFAWAGGEDSFLLTRWGRCKLIN